MKNKKYHNVRTISKYNRKIVETEIFGEKLSHLSFCWNCLKKNRVQHQERCKIVKCVQFGFWLRISIHCIYWGWVHPRCLVGLLCLTNFSTLFQVVRFPDTYFLYVSQEWPHPPPRKSSSHDIADICHKWPKTNIPIPIPV